MDQLTMDMVRLCRRHREGAFGTQKNRQRGLTAIAGQLSALGYKLNASTSIKPKHVHALVELWHNDDCSPATIRNRLSWLRWWCEKVNKPAVMAKDNRAYQAADRDDHEVDRAQQLDHSKFSKITDAHVKASILLQAAFGLRREEAIKFNPSAAIGAKRLALKGSWTKGGRYREVPILSAHQRQVLNVARSVASRGALIPEGRSYKQQLKAYEYHTSRAGLRNTHGLRHAYAQWRYKALTGFDCPHAGGKRWHEMTHAEQTADRKARKRISRELGHNRISITDVYLGRANL